MEFRCFETKEAIKAAFGVKPSKTKVGKKAVLSLEESSAFLSKALLESRPFAAVKIGEAELACLRDDARIKEKRSSLFNEKTKILMKETAGFYPTTEKHLSEYASLYESRLAQADAIGILGLRSEEYFVSEYAKEASLLNGDALNPLKGNWTSSLAGKKVLVVHPFTDDIAFQYQRKDKIFKNHSQILPDFDLKLLSSPLTVGEEVDYRFPSFMRALEEMEGRIGQVDFDIALVGCGAYGSLLALYIKSIGKIAIQTGGSTQLLFGIMGSRWEKEPYVQTLQNEYWIRPLLKPKGFEKIAKGAYW